MKISILDRTYSSFFTQDNSSNIEINPIDLKLFDGDEFTYIDQDFKLINSTVRNSTYLCGVLKLDDNKTYGRTSNKKRLMYKCVPYDKKLPVFLVPYNIDIVFNKKNKNKFVLFKFSEWDKHNIHPNGIIIETIGNVDDIHSMYFYNLYSKHLNHSIKLFTQKTRLLCPPNQIKCMKPVKKFTFSIDPVNCRDFDDAFSIEYINDEFCVSVYIADVVTNIEAYNLWDVFSERVSSIYLPHKRLCLIPESFSENYCGLQEKKINKSMKVDFYFNRDGTEKKEKKEVVNMVDVYINKNYVYEEESLMNDPQYMSLLNLVVSCSNL
jgi:exoribonuclease R